MKRFTIITFYSTLLLSAFACSKPIVEPIELLQEYSFTYNGIENSGRINDFLPELTVSSFNGKDYISINMIQLFGGVVYLDQYNCAFLEPEFTKVYHDDDCNLTSLVNGQIVPIDSAKVFTYESGFLNVTFSQCTTITVDIFGPYSYESCKASGTFELTLVNRNNERIEIKDGIFKNMNAFPE